MYPDARYDCTVSAANPICTLTDPAEAEATNACPEGYGLAEPLGSTGYFSGAAGDGRICTCDYWGRNRVAKLTTANGMTQREEADAGRCAQACLDNEDCGYVFYRRRSGECFLIRSCPRFIATWVGSAQREGGVTLKIFRGETPEATMMQVSVQENDESDVVQFTQSGVPAGEVTLRSGVLAVTLVAVLAVLAVTLSLVAVLAVVLTRRGTGASAAARLTRRLDKAELGAFLA